MLQASQHIRSQPIDKHTMFQSKPIQCSAIDCTCCTCPTYYTYMTARLYLWVPVDYKLTPSGFPPFSWRINLSNLIKLILYQSQPISRNPSSGVYHKSGLPDHNQANILNSSLSRQGPASPVLPRLHTLSLMIPLYKYGGRLSHSQQIGRASCRERVYVLV